uniref:C-type lectin domain-containing protein n=1 Tax=Branchiostoma floridae TaxID=7739 RepID=C3YTJ4_BRAFL|eukprot:XP_002600109.1 hypothetical protein BRAFLDRAFT_66618 [Branchiostoma floridae]
MDNNVYREACNVYDSCNEDGSSEYEEACNVYETCNEDTCNDEEEACAGSPSRTPKRVTGLNSTSDVPGEPDPSSSQANENRKAANPRPGPASAEPEYIPGVGMKGPAAEISDLKLAVSKLDTKTETALHDVEAIVAKLEDSELGKEEKTLHRQTNLENNTTNLQDKLEEEYDPTHLRATCPDGYKKYREVCYKAFNTAKNFSEAAETCQADGGTLAMPRDAGIDAFLVSLKNAVDPNRLFWFGLRYKRQEGKWEWIDGTALGTNYSRWSDGVSIYNPERRHRTCTLYRVRKWLPLHCDVAFFFICQVLPPG